MLTLQDRPFSFSEIIGQKNIVREMKRRSKTLDYPEVMLFQGPSGTGKTTLACIIAALLNDPSPLQDPDGTLEPNPESPASVDIRETRFHRDVIFKDASSMSKEDVLGLASEVATSPMYDKNKILIIDEAQFLSKMGKGAMLTFLEKKKKGTYVIMCTMDASVFDKAIRSRAVEYRFRSPTEDEIAQYLFSYTERLSLPVTDDTRDFYTNGLYTIATGCQGSVRMALQMFERCIEGEIYRDEDIEREFGTVSTKKFDQIVKNLIDKKDRQAVSDLMNLEVEDAYRLLMSSLTNIYLYRTTGYSSTEWGARQSSQIESIDRVRLLLELLKDVPTSPFIRKDLFIYALSKYYDSSEPTGISSPPTTSTFRRGGRQRVQV